MKSSCILAYICLFSLFIIGGVFSQTQDWGNYSVSLWGGNVTAIAMDPTDAKAVYIGTAEGGVFKFQNGEWHNISFNLQNIQISSLLLKNATSKILYAGTNHGIQYLDLSSTIWQKYDILDESIRIKKLRDCPSQNAFYAITDGGHLYGINCEKKTYQSKLNESINDVVTFRNDWNDKVDKIGKIYVGTDHGFYRYYDIFNSNEHVKGLEDKKINCLAVRYFKNSDIQNEYPDVVFAGTTEGGYFNYLKNKDKSGWCYCDTLSGKNIIDLEPNFSNILNFIGLYCMTEEKEIWRIKNINFDPHPPGDFKDNFKKWEKINYDNLLKSFAINCLNAFDSTTDINQPYLGTENGIYQLINENWITQNKSNFTAHQIFDFFYYKTKSLLYATTETGIFFIQTDQRDPAWIKTCEFPNTRKIALKKDTHYPIYFSTENQGIYRINSPNSPPEYIGLKNYTINNIIVANSGCLYAGTSQGIRKYNDFDFKSVCSPLDNENIIDIAIKEQSNSNILFAASFSKIYKIDIQNDTIIRSWDVSSTASICYDTVNNLLFIGTDNGLYTIKNDTLSNIQEPFIKIKKLKLAHDNQNTGLLYIFGDTQSESNLIYRTSVTRSTQKYLEKFIPATKRIINSFEVKSDDYTTSYLGSNGQSVYKFNIPYAPDGIPENLNFNIIPAKKDSKITFSLTNKNKSTSLECSLSLTGKNSDIFQVDKSTFKLPSGCSPKEINVIFPPIKSGNYEAELLLEWKNESNPSEYCGKSSISLSGESSNLLINNNEDDSIQIPSIEGHFFKETPICIDYLKVNGDDFNSFLIDKSKLPFDFTASGWENILEQKVSSDKLPLTFKPMITDPIKFSTYQGTIAIDYQQKQYKDLKKTLQINGNVKSSYLLCNPDHYDFAAVPFHDKSQTIKIEIKNIGNLKLTIDDYFIIDTQTQERMDEPFYIDLNWTTLKVGDEIQPKNEKFIGIYFKSDLEEEKFYQYVLKIIYHDEKCLNIDNFIKLDGKSRKHILSPIPATESNFGSIHFITDSCDQKRKRELTLENSSKEHMIFIDSLNVWTDTTREKKSSDFKIIENVPFEINLENAKKIHLKCIDTTYGDFNAILQVKYRYGNQTDKYGPFDRELSLKAHLFGADFNCDSSQWRTSLTNLFDSCSTILNVGNKGNHPLYFQLTCPSTKFYNFKKWKSNVEGAIPKQESKFDTLVFRPDSIVVPPDNISIKYWDFQDNEQTVKGIEGSYTINLIGHAYDKIPPIINLYDFQFTANEEANLEVQITDDSPLKSNALFIHFRKAGEKTIDSLILQKKENFQNEYKVQIPATFITERGFEYYFEASDISEGHAFYPDSLNMKHPDSTRFCYFSPAIKIPNGISSKLKKRSLHWNGSISKEDYQLISIPLQLDNDNVQSILSQSLGDDLNGFWWRCADYREKKYHYDYKGNSFSKFLPGKAFFLIRRQEKSNDLLKSGAGQNICTNQSYVIPLQAGWNLIANPFNFSIPIECIKYDTLSTHLKKDELLTWERDWVPEYDSIKPWYGYAIWAATQRSLEINPDVRHEFSAKETLNKTHDWWLNITVICEDVISKNIYIAVNKSASSEFDEYDRPQPPSVDESLQVGFPHPEWEVPADFFSSDIQAPSDSGNYWDFEVYSNITNSSITLTFNNISNLPSDLKISLLGENLKYIRDLRQNHEITFPSNLAKNGQKFRLLIGSSEFIDHNNLNGQIFPEKFNLSDNYPNPFNSSTSITYELPEAEILTIFVYNILGETIKIYKNQALEYPGKYTITWNGTDLNNLSVSNGIYFLKLISEKYSKTIKMVIIR